ncbi:MAG: tetratricopeptide repeat protein [Alphaproteobacteria bacterium]|nr:tetratricopeptide repeat protein [Alphaproteobacteria bacterium]QQS58097.1 MAG: tetratricopeptide repeat protein [Alphaproteobacteria bacterium]
MKHSPIFVFFALLLMLGQAYAYTENDMEDGRKYYDEKSWQLALEQFGKLLEQKTEREDLSREVLFKWSDCILRLNDQAQALKATQNLQTIITGKEQDRWWAESNVALAIYFIQIDPYGKQQDVRLALDSARNWWAGSTDLDLARAKFLEISFQLADFITTRWGWYYTEIQPIRLGEAQKMIAPPTPNPQPSNIGLQVLYEEILKVAQTDDDKARAHYGLAMASMSNYTGDQKLHDKAAEEFNIVIKDFPKSEWADDAFYQLGMSYENRQDFVKAVEIYNLFISTFKPGESQWLDEIKRRVEYITQPQLNISTGQTFVPGSQVNLNLNWRNIKDVEFTLYNLDMTQAMSLSNFPNGINSYYDVVQRFRDNKGLMANLPVALQWKLNMNDEGKHIYHGESRSLAKWRVSEPGGAFKPEDGILPVGAYILVVRSGATEALDLILVSESALLSKITKDKALLWAVNAKTGQPLPDVVIKYVYSYYDVQGHTYWKEGEGVTDSQGLLTADLVYPQGGQAYQRQHNVFAVVSDKTTGQAFVQNNYYYNEYNNKGEWWFYAFTDRPAYRPNETVSFKGILRRPHEGGFQIHAGKRVKVQIMNPQGQQVKEEIFTLNEYGAFSGELTLDEKAVLGQYSVNLMAEDNSMYMGAAQIFRLEEYKLPEFTVTVTPKEKEVKEGEINAYRLGDTLEVEVDSQYYFGGAVAEADVEYLVYQQPYYQYYWPVRPYPWYYEDIYPRQQNYGYYGNLMEQKKIKTDKDGKAHFTIETPKDSPNDLQYHVEVRVVDKSRREIIGSSDIKVTKNAFFAFLEPKESLYRPGDKAKVTIRTMTANELPVGVEGKVTVLRNWWRDPVIQDSRMIKPAGYDGTELFTKFVKTNEKGEAEFEFEPNENGYYEIRFTGFDNGNEVIGRTYIFVCEPSAINIGYQYSGLQIITEKDTYKPGETAQAMIVTDRPGLWVMFSQESDELYNYQLIEMKGTVKLIEIPITDKFTPNIFLNAESVDMFQIKQNAVQIIVPPDDKLLNVKVTSDKVVYQPQEEGTYEIEVTDGNGKPVSGEIALGITDASVYYIQSELAEDIRKFFYGAKKYDSIQTYASFYQYAFVNYALDENGNIILQSQLDDLKKQKSDGGEQELLRQDESQVGGMRRLKEGVATNGFGGGAMGDMAYNMASPAPAAAPMESGASMMSMEADAVAPMREEKMMAKSAVMADKNSAAIPGQAGPEPQLRTDFRSTVIWLPSVVTDANGKATVKAKFPDSLTTWRMTARAITTETAVGTVTHDVKSNKELMVRLQAPRFFTERDLVDVSALIDNMSGEEITVTPEIKVEGLDVTGLFQNGQFVKGEQGPVKVPANGQTRVDWAVFAKDAGTAKITVTARGQKNADAMEKTFPVIPHGIEKFIAQAAILKSEYGKQERELKISIPKERIKESTSLQITISPSMAANLLDALPYLADYPYGCVEQTMSRFLPAIIVRKTMRDLGIADQDIAAYLSDVLEPRNDPAGHPEKRTDATYKKLDDMVDQGLKRLYDFQHSDGGWGWWKEGDSDRYMTAYVLWGLSLTQQSGVNVRPDIIENAKRFLQVQLVQEESNPDMLAWMLFALAESGSKSEFEDKQRERLWEMRDKLNPYTRALHALGEHKRGNGEGTKILAQNLINGVLEDKDSGTAHWGESGIYYRWSEGGVEGTAFVIKALSNIDPTSAYLEPAVKWMSLNRRGASWKNTRDTAMAILGLADYLKASKELAPNYNYQVIVNGKMVREGKVDETNIFSFNRIIDIPADALKDGENTVKIVMDGKGALYASAYTKYFTLEEPITKAGNEIFVTRKYFIQSVKETLMKGLAQDWKPLNDGDTVNSGDRIRVDIELEAKNHYEYLVSEDYKPAGLEAVQLQSGPGWFTGIDAQGHETGGQSYLYQEFRDQKAAFFIDKLKQGKHKISYELRAEVPGTFHAMPNQTHAMYVPEIRTNSDEMRVTVGERVEE